MRVAVLPARGGSKRIKRKNIRSFCGAPMISWPIRTALKSNCFEHVVVSTDDPEIAKIARQFGAKTPFTRPAELSDDHTGTVPVITHALAECEKLFGPVDDLCCLYATAAFVLAEDLQIGLRILLGAKAEYTFSGAAFPAPIQRALHLDETGFARMVSPEFDQVRSQDLPMRYHDAGQFYWGEANSWRESRDILGGERSAMVVIPGSRVVDIDTPDDWDRAEAMFRALGLDRP
ncbi:MAG: pseudaminic acid cytidylyltransferase [Pseudomonadota bacterium]